MRLILQLLQRFGLWLAGDEVRAVRVEEYARGYREGLTDGMAIEAQEQERREVERLADVTPEPHDACTTPSDLHTPEDLRALLCDHRPPYGIPAGTYGVSDTELQAQVQQELHAQMERGEARVVDRL